MLTQFEGAGLVTRHHFEDGMAVFEINHGTHHDHIVCMDCGAVEEFVDPGIEARQNAVAQRLGFTIEEHSWCSTAAASGPTAPHARDRVPAWRASAPDYDPAFLTRPARVWRRRSAAGSATGEVDGVGAAAAATVLVTAAAFSISSAWPARAV